MKKIKIALLALILVVIFASCSQEDSPETVTRKFANHFAMGEYKEAAQYGTANTIQLLEMMETLASIGAYLPHEDDSIELITDRDVECLITDNTAVCTYLEYGELVDLNLLKMDGKWLVDFPLDDFFNDEDWYEDEDEDEDEDWEFDGTEIRLN
jgi:hypothetical protein